jgi:hypothetical protein
LIILKGTGVYLTDTSSNDSNPQNPQPALWTLITDGIGAPVRMWRSVKEERGWSGLGLVIALPLLLLSVLANSGSYSDPFGSSSSRSFGWTAVIAVLVIAGVHTSRQDRTQPNWWVSTFALLTVWTPLFHFGLQLMYAIVSSIVLIVLLLAGAWIALKVLFSGDDTAPTSRPPSDGVTASPREIWEARWDNDDGTGCKPRPIIVVSTSLFGGTIRAIGVTSQSKHKHRYGYRQVFGDFGDNTKDSYAMYGDPRTLRRGDLMYRKGKLDRRQFTTLRQLLESPPARG